MKYTIFAAVVCIAFVGAAVVLILAGHPWWGALFAILAAMRGAN